MEPLKIISLGMGVQSTCLYLMSSMGQIDRCDFAVFIDTGREKQATLQYLEFLLQWRIKHLGIPIIVVRKKNLYRDLLDQVNSTGKRFASIPAFTQNEDGSTGILRRQCTNEYKIEQVYKCVRELYGLQPRKRMPNTFIYKGISLDEIDRMAIPQNKWATHVYPFIGYHVSRSDTKRVDFYDKMSRVQIISWYLKHNLPVPPKSACVFCPYQSDASYYDMKINYPEDFKAAVDVDHAIRNSSKKGINNPIYLHRSLKPLDQVNFSKNSNDLWQGECSGNCHL